LTFIRNGLGVGISTVFKIFGHFLFQEDGTTTYCHKLLYHQMFLDTRNNNMYGLGVGISTVFEILGHFLF
jgi:hypothetical protein